jgi:hypothetical protein
MLFSIGRRWSSCSMNSHKFNNRCISSDGAVGDVIA